MDCEKRGLTAHDALLYLVVGVLLTVNVFLLFPAKSTAQSSTKNYATRKTGNWKMNLSALSFNGPAESDPAFTDPDSEIEGEVWGDPRGDSLDFGFGEDDWGMEVDEYPSDCFLDTSARGCSAEDSKEDGSFCKWLDGCVGLVGQCSSFYSKCSKAAQWRNKKKERPPNPCCKCGEFDAGRKFNDAKLAKRVCPRSTPDDISGLDILSLVFQEEAQTMLSTCDLNQNHCLDTTEELIAVASLRSQGELNLTNQELLKKSTAMLLRVLRSRIESGMANQVMLENLDTNNDGCISEDESLVAKLPLGRCTITFVPESFWSSSLPKPLSDRYAVSIGTTTGEQCKEVYGGKWTQNDTLNCLSPGLSEKIINKDMRSMITNIIEDAKTKDPLILTFKELILYHRSLKDDYEDIPDINAHFHLTSTFHAFDDCKFQASSAVHKASLPIPNIVHQSWKSRSSIPDFAIDWIASWLKFNPKATYIFWDDIDNDKFIETRFPAFAVAYHSMKPVEKADFARYGYLYEFGGIYADMDSECVKNFDELREKHHAFIGQEPWFHAKLLEKRDKQFASNALMGSVKGHPFWLYLMTGIAVGSGEGDPVTKTGPRRISMVHDNFFNLPSASEHHGKVEIMPEEYFMPEPAWWNINSMQRACEDAEFFDTDDDGSMRDTCKKLREAYDMHEKEEKGEKKVWGKKTYSIHNWRCTWCRGTGTEKFIDINKIPIMKEFCKKPQITATSETWLPTYSQPSEGKIETSAPNEKAKNLLSKLDSSQTGNDGSIKPEVKIDGTSLELGKASSKIEKKSSKVEEDIIELSESTR